MKHVPHVLIYEFTPKIFLQLDHKKYTPIQSLLCAIAIKNACQAFSSVK
ncbi:unnamed protein product [Acanthoscelides obtectus]|uniref:Uncharacterized protein n=1 Tax=Acanthoscelides obtectus TaxID=200917 RepID=A0A9P0K7T0_ACAOB|nr:unnamed protein product [Acanthoscelides obtectus]CAK1628479.1 hypothetical protein AOBTE_LOCUS5237 [Acanthoscelides obtectus]